jgi:hypothetical protein
MSKKRPGSRSYRGASDRAKSEPGQETLPLWLRLLHSRSAQGHAHPTTRLRPTNGLILHHRMGWPSLNQPRAGWEQAASRPKRARGWETIDSIVPSKVRAVNPRAVATDPTSGRVAPACECAYRTSTSRIGTTKEGRLRASQQTDAAAISVWTAFQPPCEMAKVLRKRIPIREPCSSRVLLAGLHSAPVRRERADQPKLSQCHAADGHLVRNLAELVSTKFGGFPFENCTYHFGHRGHRMRQSTIILTVNAATLWRPSCRPEHVGSKGSRHMHRAEMGEQLATDRLHAARVRQRHRFRCLRARSADTRWLGCPRAPGAQWVGFSGVLPWSRDCRQRCNRSMPVLRKGCTYEDEDSGLDGLCRCRRRVGHDGQCDCS